MSRQNEEKDFEEFVSNVEDGLFKKDRFKEMGKENDLIFQSLVFLGEGSQKLSLVTTVLGHEENVPEELKDELKAIQQHVHNFKDKLRSLK